MCAKLVLVRKQFASCLDLLGFPTPHSPGKAVVRLLTWKKNKERKTIRGKLDVWGRGHSWMWFPLGIKASSRLLSLLSRRTFLWDTTPYPHVPLQTHSVTSQHVVFSHHTRLHLEKCQMCNRLQWANHPNHFSFLSLCWNILSFYSVTAVTHCTVPAAFHSAESVFDIRWNE